MPPSKEKKASSASTRSGAVLYYVIVIVLVLALFETLMISWPLFRTFVTDVTRVWVWAGLLQVVALVVLEVLEQFDLRRR